MKGIAPHEPKAELLSVEDVNKAEDLEGGDLEYVEWAGEAKLLEGLEAELTKAEKTFPALKERKQED